MIALTKWTKLERSVTRKFAENANFSLGFFSLLKRNFRSGPATWILLSSDSGFMKKKVNQSLMNKEYLQDPLLSSFKD